MMGIEPEHRGSTRARFSSQASAGKSSATQAKIRVFILYALFLQVIDLDSRMRADAPVAPVAAMRRGLGSSKRTKTAGMPVLMPGT